jgi:NarL family two-component system sensor histidine kinase LiaS
MVNKIPFPQYNNYMDTPSSYTRRFRQLRWKLMLSYTGVTIGAILVVGLFAAVVAYLWLDNQLKKTDLPYQLVEIAAAKYVIELRPMLNQSPPDQENISSLLVRVETTSTLILLDDVPMTLNPGELQALVVDTQGILLGATSAPVLEESITNEFLDAHEIPQLSEALQAALAGQEGPPGWQRSTISGDFVITAPVWDLAGEQVLGALIISFTVPTPASLIGLFTQSLVLDVLVIMLLTGVIGIVFGLLFGRGITSRLDQLADATLAWSQGDFTVYVDDPSEDELGQLAQRLNNMARQLQHLLDTRTQLLVVEERNRLARDLHDSAKQMAFAASAQISTVRRLIEQDPQQAQSHVEQADRLINDLREELTNLIKELRPPVLKDKGLVLALKEVAADWSQQNGIELDLRVKNERSLPLDIEQAVYKIVQEALSNVARHSQADNVFLRLVYSDQSLKCSIKDDGKGFDPLKDHAGFGLQSLRERASGLGSELQISSIIGNGTEISFEVPL